MAFGGNDRPGVMQASAIRTYVNRFGVSPGSCAGIFTTTDNGWRSAADLVAAMANASPPLMPLPLIWSVPALTVVAPV